MVGVKRAGIAAAQWRWVRAALRRAIQRRVAMETLPARGVPDARHRTSAGRAVSPSLRQRDSRHLDLDLDHLVHTHTVINAAAASAIVWATLVAWAVGAAGLEVPTPGLLRAKGLGCFKGKRNGCTPRMMNLTRC